MVIYDSRRFTNENAIIAQTLLEQFKKQHQNNSFIIRQKETGTQKTYDSFPDNIDPQTIRYIEQTASMLYYQTTDQKTALIFTNEKETAHGKNS